MAPSIVDPLPVEFLVVGVIGIVLYVCILLCSAYMYAFSLASRQNSVSMLFFMLCCITCVFELPRYCCLAAEEAYVSQDAYACHLFSSIFFFAAFSCVIYQWSGLLSLASYFKTIYGKKALLMANIFFAIVDFVGMGYCLSSSSLQFFFDSLPFEIITLLEAVRNVVYSGFLSFFGLQLVYKFHHYSSIETTLPSSNKATTSTTSSANNHLTQSLLQDSERTSSSAAAASIPIATTATTTTTPQMGFNVQQQHQQPATSTSSSSSLSKPFARALLRLSLVLVLSTICFLSRFAMLVAKISALHTNNAITSSEFSLFGVAWFTLADFLPRAFPMITFILLMATSHKGTSHHSDAEQEVYANKYVHQSEADRRNTNVSISNVSQSSLGSSLDHLTHSNSGDYQHYDRSRSGTSPNGSEQDDEQLANMWRSSA